MGEWTLIKDKKPGSGKRVIYLFNNGEAESSRAMGAINDIAIAWMPLELSKEVKGEIVKRIGFLP